MHASLVTSSSRAHEGNIAIWNSSCCLLAFLSAQQFYFSCHVTMYCIMNQWKRELLKEKIQLYNNILNFIHQQYFESQSHRGWNGMYMCGKTENLSPVHKTKFPFTSFPLTSFICSCVQHKLTSCFLEKGPCSKAGMTSFWTRKIVKEKLFNLRCTYEQIKLVKGKYGRVYWA